MLPAFAVFGDAGAGHPVAAGRVPEYFRAFLEGFLPATNEVSCDGATDGYVAKYIDAMRIAAEVFLTSTNYGVMFAASDFIRNFPLFAAHRLLGNMAPARLPSKYIHPQTGPELFAHVGKRYNDDRARGLPEMYVERALLSETSSGFLRQAWQLLLWYEPWEPRAAVESLPLVFSGRCSGYYFSRSDWRLGPDAETVVGRFFNGNVDVERHWSQNHFTIARGSDVLAIDSGQRAENGDYGWAYGQYYTRTAAHNAITILDPNEDFGIHSYSRLPRPNDGGQCCGDAAEGVRRWPHISKAFRGEITRFESSDDYTYLESDVTPAYRATKTNLVVRAWVHLRPNLFLVFDKVDARDASFPKKFLLHMVERPVLDGTIPLLGGVLEGNLATGGVFRSRNSSLVTIRNGASALLLKTLLPEHPVITLIGGANLDVT